MSIRLSVTVASLQINRRIFYPTLYVTQSRDILFLGANQAQGDKTTMTATKNTLARFIRNE